jgi:hypothetical protein
VTIAASQAGRNKDSHPIVHFLGDSEATQDMMEETTAYVPWCQTGLIPLPLLVISFVEPLIVSVFGHPSAAIVRWAAYPQ